MGWNEPPGGGNGGRDPWSGRGNDGGPPDLDEMLRRLQRSFGGIFGGGPNVGGPGLPPVYWFGGLLIALALILFDITHILDQQERGIVLRFGRYATTLQPGLNFVYPSLIDEVIRVNVGQVRSITHKATMLTQDENIVDVEVAVQWRISDPADYVFNVMDPAEALRQVAESSVRRIIGKNKLDFILTEGRRENAQAQQDLMQTILSDYRAGITVVKVDMQPAKPPEQVKDAFDDAIKAREDEQRLVNEAEAYSNEIKPRARGAAARLREESNAYKATVIARAEGEAARFEQLLAEYERAPAITRERLYLDAMQGVMANTGKVMLDAQGGNNVVYLPLDRLMDNTRGAAGASPAQSVAPGAARNAAAELDTINAAAVRARPNR
ncbi:MAG: HflK protein [Gammaproteobacteria bacterium RIFCSPLOWO2_02_FULL_61_13]|nr:MAG: HflK protein [Gammaproteobacteria bacterium RIFCSPLOWO2_02_FULL_61_13]